MEQGHIKQVVLNLRVNRVPGAAWPGGHLLTLQTFWEKRGVLEASRGGAFSAPVGICAEPPCFFLGAWALLTGRADSVLGPRFLCSQQPVCAERLCLRDDGGSPGGDGEDLHRERSALIWGRWGSDGELPASAAARLPSAPNCLHAQVACFGVACSAGDEKLCLGMSALCVSGLCVRALTNYRVRILGGQMCTCTKPR